MSERQQSKRPTKFVDGKVQGALAWRVIRHFCTFIVLGGAFGLLIHYLSNPFLPFAEHCSNFWATSGPYLFTLVLLLPVFVYDTMKLSNRMAGPIHRLRSTMCEIRDGENAAELKFRDGDFWQEMAVEFNEMVAQLKQSEAKLIAEQDRETVGV